MRVHVLENYIADGSSWSDDKVMKAENGENVI